MSHESVPGEEWFASVEEFDRQIAEAVAAAGCRHCGGPLHRKPSTDDVWWRTVGHGPIRACRDRSCVCLHRGLRGGRRSRPVGRWKSTLLRG
jgi:hypothetical protein